MAKSKQERAVEEAERTTKWRLYAYTNRGRAHMKCACGVHQKWLHQTPSDPNYFKNQIRNMKTLCP
jgi:hypothetical protein